MSYMQGPSACTPALHHCRYAVSGLLCLIHDAASQMVLTSTHAQAKVGQAGLLHRIVTCTLGQGAATLLFSEQPPQDVAIHGLCWPCWAMPASRAVEAGLEMLGPLQGAQHNSSCVAGTWLLSLPHWRGVWWPSAACMPGSSPDATLSEPSIRPEGALYLIRVWQASGAIASLAYEGAPPATFLQHSCCHPVHLRVAWLHGLKLEAGATLVRSSKRVSYHVLHDKANRATLIVPRAAEYLRDQGFQPVQSRKCHTLEQGTSSKSTRLKPTEPVQALAASKPQSISHIYRLCRTPWER